MRYAVLIEKTETGYTARVPDLAGCAATAASLADARKEIRDALRQHLAKLERDGLPAPEPSTTVEYVDG
ncbi:MAG: type II toxin-antitoxin system HicB family antitoxin [Geminicoccaceae bacterium]